jgi:hypothetical protein
VSADGLFAGVTATGVALLAHGVTRGSALGALVGGALLGFGCYLSYGLVLMVPIALAVVILGHRHRPTAWWALAGAALVVGAFTAAGFDWLTGYHLVIERYYQGIASRRAYGYWVWANLALLTVAAGPAAAVILRRGTVAGWQSIASLRRRAGLIEPIGGSPGCATWLLPLAAAAAIVAADLSGYSRAEVERIWLPFAGWLMAGAALLPGPGRRSWLTAQAAVALAVNHLLLTAW